ncbi:MAG: MauE/DoxX family redox-associated membrane protein [Candidatus Nanohaloarchaea archaeon]|nr:MauE/DoxX family redox-associated membrane protein [Candidatus Nanohaloarchaea archaeon]
MGVFPDFMVSLARFVLGGVFLWSGGVKLKDIRGFVLIASTYTVVPEFLSRPARLVSYLIPFTELLAGGLVIIWDMQLYALYFIAASLLGYMTLQICELLKNGNVDNCGCYGTAIEVELSWKQVLKNAVLLGLALYLLAYENGLVFLYPF